MSIVVIMIIKAVITVTYIFWTGFFRFLAA